MHQKWNIAAANIQKEASNIFSFGVISDCSEISLRSASRRKKLDIMMFTLTSVVGNSIKNTMKRNIAYVFALLSVLRRVIKLVRNSAPAKRSRSPDFWPISR
jgi:hypothetical protein